MTLGTFSVNLPPLSAAIPTSQPEQSEISGQKLPEYSGIYPHLAHFNFSRECGTGGVVPWADRLWVITYSPHKPEGSSDKLYEIDQSLQRTIRPESVGGTPANRMIHLESSQLFLGPYVIDTQRNVRVISPSIMPGRLTGNARHLYDPVNKIYFATMEEGFYEVDVHDLGVTELYPDANKPGAIVTAGDLLPGYHGKGLYSGQGRLIYANNGEYSDLAMTNPDIPSGALATWDGRDWTVVRRNQFTEVTGPGGIYGNPNPSNDPVWSIGWDHRSLILMLLDKGQWSSYRLPKASHAYDGAHGWNTEWPRIRDIGTEDLMMTMHGMFWRFPKGFRLGQTQGIAPRATYLKVIGDFCHWNDHLVFGCDDAAKSEFLNKRKAKGELAPPAQSQSNLWFIEPERIDSLGVPFGRGAVWLDDEVKARQYSEPFLLGGFEKRGVHIVHDEDGTVVFRFEVDIRGDDNWTLLEEVTVTSAGYKFWEIPSAERGEWIRVSTNRACETTVWFSYRNTDSRSPTPDSRFEGLAQTTPNRKVQGALLRAGEQRVGLQLLATELDNHETRTLGYYELDPGMQLRRVDSAEKQRWMTENVAIPKHVLELEGRSVLYVDEEGNRFRLPIGNTYYLEHRELLEKQRADREVCTERDLFQCAGTFFELPAQNAGGFSKIRPVATHPLFIHDYCSWRGLLVLSGLDLNAASRNQHILRSRDGKCAVWLGAIDDLWKLGKAVGIGGPWSDTTVKAGVPSDPYLMTGYDRKKLTLSHSATSEVAITVQIDITGTGSWQNYRVIQVPAGEVAVHDFPDAFDAYWIRFFTSEDCSATAQLQYN